MSPSSRSTNQLRISSSPDFPEWLAEERVSVAFSTYQLGKLFLVGLNQHNELSVFERTFNRCMGLWTDTQTLWLASAFQLWCLQNVLAADCFEGGFDRLFVPRAAFTTADIDIHDISVDAEGQIAFANTLFSCVATLSERWNFETIYKPPFISRLAAEDGCHLNGLAMEDGRLKYVTACSQTDCPAGWRKQRADGGCLVDVVANEVVAEGLSMPHSPRCYRNRLWLLNSGTGYLGQVDVNTGRFQSVTFCPGYARGLAFVNHHAVVGLSKPREKTFSGLQLDGELQRLRVKPQCGLQVVDLRDGAVTHWMRLDSGAEELYDVVVLPGVRRAKALGLKTNEIRENVWFEQDGKPTHWTAQANAKGGGNTGQ